MSLASVICSAKALLVPTYDRPTILLGQGGGEQSSDFGQAESRLHVQQALLYLVLGGRGNYLRTRSAYV